ncbi:MAG TPA: DUF2071 domain-containing protein [Tepidisphaeraceae bacterium]|jgi:hypothetical protein|nr:DUF2071 domain-containing protein [Tepidisphaeraceae bacterium]
MRENERPQGRVFLTARWANLAVITYPADPKRLHAYLPPGCALDLRDGRAFVSLVAFDFLSTRVMGVSWPRYRNFPEINLRFYVRHGDQRGVCFVREFVPKRIVAALARLLYNEPYCAAPISSRTSETLDTIEVRRELALAGSTHRIGVIGNKPAVRPGADSVEHFFKEHSWGFGTSRSGRLLSYRVDHPTWDVWPARSYDVDWDWKAIHGPIWAFLAGVEPCSVVLACGSEVRVSPKAVESTQPSSI